MSVEKITPPEILERPESALSEPPAEPHQHGEPGHPDDVDVPFTLPRSTDLELDVPPSMRTVMNIMDRRRVIE